MLRNCLIDKHIFSSARCTEATKSELPKVELMGKYKVTAKQQLKGKLKCLNNCQPQIQA